MRAGTSVLVIPVSPVPSTQLDTQGFAQYLLASHLTPGIILSQDA